MVQTSLLLGSLTALTSLATAMPLISSRNSDTSSCSQVTFNMKAPAGPGWSEGLYGLVTDGGGFGQDDTPFGLSMLLGTNKTSSASTFTLDTSTGRLYAEPGVYAYWIGSIGGLPPYLLFGNSSTIAGVANAAGQQPTIVKCQTPAKEGAVLTCDPDGTGTYEEWLTCYQNTQALSLIEGTSQGPYTTPAPPGPTTGYISCGSLEVLAANLKCAA